MLLIETVPFYLLFLFKIDALKEETGLGVEGQKIKI
jgi:hypothetical protein